MVCVLTNHASFHFDFPVCEDTDQGNRSKLYLLNLSSEFWFQKQYKLMKIS